MKLLFSILVSLMVMSFAFTADAYSDRKLKKSTIDASTTLPILINDLKYDPGSWEVKDVLPADYLKIEVPKVINYQQLTYRTGAFQLSAAEGDYEIGDFLYGNGDTKMVLEVDGKKIAAHAILVKQRSSKITVEIYKHKCCSSDDLIGTYQFSADLRGTLKGTTSVSEYLCEYWMCRGTAPYFAVKLPGDQVDNKVFVLLDNKRGDKIK